MCSQGRFLCVKGGVARTFFDAGGLRREQRENCSEAQLAAFGIKCPFRESGQDQREMEALPPPAHSSSRAPDVPGRLLTVLPGASAVGRGVHSVPAEDAVVIPNPHARTGPVPSLLQASYTLSLILSVRGAHHAQRCAHPPRRRWSVSLS